ncbi:MAG: hypothetical protein AB1782_07040 [Cyanobacteriota bacterium]
MNKYFKACFYIMSSLLVMIFINNSLVIAQEKNEPLSGDRIYDYMQEHNISAQKAYNEVAKLEQQLSSASINNKPEILFELAKYKTFLGIVHTETNYVKKHLDEYTYFEPANDYVYKGNDLQEIINKYPDSSLADDAAYMYSTRGPLTECEGDVKCYMNLDLYKYKDFLLKFDKSPYTKNVLKDINSDFALLYEDNPNYYIGDDTTVFFKLLDEYNSILMTMTNPLRVTGLQTLYRAYKKLNQNEKSLKVLDVINKNFPGYKLEK